jgi:hypothetical protein
MPILVYKVRFIVSGESRVRITYIAAETKADAEAKLKSRFADGDAAIEILSVEEAT